MRNFLQIAAGVDVLPLVMAIQRQPHGEVDDILLRFSDPSIARDGDTAAVMADGNCVWHPAAAALPQVRPILLDLMRRVEAYELNRVVITRLRPGGRILPHADNEGTYTADPHRARYHIVLQGLPGSLYHAGDETVCMLSGTVWSFEARVQHAVENNSADDRLHLLADMRLMP